jgi:hypothetical protein
MHLHRALALAGAVAVTLAAGCKEPPLTPRWDAPWYMPLSTQSIHLDQLLSPLPAIPGSVAAPDSFPAQRQDVSGVLGNLLKNVVTDPARCTSTVDPTRSCHLMTLTVSKTTPVDVDDTLFVADSPANLNAAGYGTVVFPIALAAGDLTRTDSLYLTQASAAMLQAAGESGAALYVQLRGQVSNPSASPVPLSGADSIAVSLSATVLIAVSHE